MTNFDIAAYLYINEIQACSLENEVDFRMAARLAIKASEIFEKEFDKHENEVNEPQQKHDDQMDSIAGIYEKAMLFSEKTHKDIRDATLETLETLEKLLGPAPESFKALIKNVPNTHEINAILHSIKKNAEIQLAGK